MAKQGQLTAAWEILSTVVMLRAKAREQKLGRLLSSLHGVEVELARIIAAGDEAGGTAAFPACGAVGVMEEGDERAKAGGTPSRPTALAEVARGRPSSSRRREDSQLEAYSRRYLALSEQLKELMIRGEVAACGPHSLFDGSNAETQADAILSEQHDLSLQISRLKATSLGGLRSKAAVLDDLAEENSDDPVQALAVSLAQDVIALHEGSRVAS